MMLADLKLLADYILENPDKCKIDEHQIAVSESTLAFSHELNVEETLEGLEVSFAKNRLRIFSSENEFFNANFYPEYSYIVLLDESWKIYHSETTHFHRDSDSKDIFVNQLAREQLFSFLKKAHSDEKFDFDFVDASSGRIFTFVNANFGRRLRIKFPTLPSRSLSESKSMIDSVTSFIDYHKASNEQQLLLLKVSVIEYLFGKDVDSQVEDLMLGLEKIVGAAKLNYSILVNKTSIKTLRNEYADIKKQFLNEVRGITDQLAKTTVSLPILSIATIYTLSKILTNSDNELVLGLIAILGIAGYYNVFNAFFVLNDLQTISNDAEIQRNNVSSHTFLSEYPDQKQEFTSIIDTVELKIATIERLSISYIFTTLVVISCLMTYCLDQIYTIKYTGYILPSFRFEVALMVLVLNSLVLLLSHRLVFSNSRLAKKKP